MLLDVVAPLTLQVATLLLQLLLLSRELLSEVQTTVEVVSLGAASTTTRSMAARWPLPTARRAPRAARCERPTLSSTLRGNPL